MANDTEMILELFDALLGSVRDLTHWDHERCRPYEDVLWKHEARYEQIKMHEIGRGLTAWGNAMKWFVYGCVAGGGQTNAHGAYMHSDGKCSFCHQPVDQKPKQRAVLKEKP